jgi:hypothetical protein
LVTVLSVLSFLLVIAEVINKPSGATIDWGLYLLIAFTLLQAIVAVAALLFDSGIITPPAPRPKYDQQHYGQYGGPGGSYYGQPQVGGPPQQGQQQRPGYPGGYGGYGGSNPGSGGYSGTPQGGTPVGPPTPPTGFPTYGQPPSTSTPTTQTPAHGSSSSQSGPTPS